MGSVRWPPATCEWFNRQLNAISRWALGTSEWHDLTLETGSIRSSSRGALLASHTSSISPWTLRSIISSSFACSIVLCLLHPSLISSFTELARRIYLPCHWRSLLAKLTIGFRCPDNTHLGTVSLCGWSSAATSIVAVIVVYWNSWRDTPPPCPTDYIILSIDGWTLRQKIAEVQLLPWKHKRKWNLILIV